MNSKQFKALFSFSTLIGTVRILQEVVVPLHPEGALWSCYQKIGCQGTASGSLRIPSQVVTGKNRLGISKYRKVQCRPVCSDVLFVYSFLGVIKSCLWLDFVSLFQKCNSAVHMFRTRECVKNTNFLCDLVNISNTSHMPFNFPSGCIARDASNTEHYISGATFVLQNIHDIT